MKKRVYISSDYAPDNGDRNVVDVLTKWGSDNQHIVDFVDMAQVVSGSVSQNPDCRPCDLKLEFNRQINASSVAIFVVGDKTASRTAGSNCSRSKNAQSLCSCTPYKQNTNGTKTCKVYSTKLVGADDDVGEINAFSYLQHEFEQAKKRHKQIIIVYNSPTKQPNWLPSYMKGYESIAEPFWTRNDWGDKVGNYSFIKKELGYV